MYQKTQKKDDRQVTDWEKRPAINTAEWLESRIYTALTQSSKKNWHKIQAGNSQKQQKWKTYKKVHITTQGFTGGE